MVLAGARQSWHADRMDLSAWVLVAVIGWTVLGLLLVAFLWSRAPWKAVLAWLGLTLVPLGLWLVGLSQAAIDGWNTVALWWQGLVYSLPVLIGLSVLGLAIGLLVISRVVPTKPRNRKPKPTPTTTPPPSTRSSGGSGSYGGSSTGPTYSQPPASQNPAERTLILPENQPNP